METNRPLDSQMGDQLHISGQSAYYLKETAGWARFLGILGFVFIGLFVILALSIGAILGSLPGGETLPFPPALISIFYLLFALLYFFPVLYLYRFAIQMRRALSGGGQMDLESAFANIKSHYKFIGIFTAIMVGVYVLMFIIMLFGGFMSLFV